MLPVLIHLEVWFPVSLWSSSSALLDTPPPPAASELLWLKNKIKEDLRFMLTAAQQQQKPFAWKLTKFFVVFIIVQLQDLLFK